MKSQITKALIVSLITGYSLSALAQIAVKPKPTQLKAPVATARPGNVPQVKPAANLQTFKASVGAAAPTQVAQQNVVSGQSCSPADRLHYGASCCVM